MNKFLKKNFKKKLVVLDIPLLVENKLYKKNYILLYIQADTKEIQSRLKKRKNFNKKIYNDLKMLQLPLSKKKKLANFIIFNDFKMKNLSKNVKIIKNKILKK
jgi:dephospho-CoA kinase